MSKGHQTGCLYGNAEMVAIVDVSVDLFHKCLEPNFARSHSVDWAFKYKGAVFARISITAAAVPAGVSLVKLM